MVMMMTAAAAFAMVVVLLCVRLCSDCIRAFLVVHGSLSLERFIHIERNSLLSSLVVFTENAEQKQILAQTETDIPKGCFCIRIWICRKMRNTKTHSLSQIHVDPDGLTHTLVSVDSGIAEHIDSLSVTLVDQPIDRKDGRLASWTIRKIVWAWID